VNKKDIHSKNPGKTGVFAIYTGKNCTFLVAHRLLTFSGYRSWEAMRSSLSEVCHRSWDKRARQERGSKCSPALVLVNLKCGLPERWKAASAAAAENVYRGKLSRKKTDKAFFRNTGSKVKSIDKCSKFIVE